jgi:hypothetical protein
MARNPRPQNSPCDLGGAVLHDCSHRLSHISLPIEGAVVPKHILVRDNSIDIDARLFRVDDITSL